MQSENFDKKIRDSLSQRPPGNDKPEWDKMEVLLDKHLPVEKKDRRRIFFILFSFLLLGGGAFVIWQNNKGSRNDIAEIKSQKSTTEIKENNKPGNISDDKEKTSSEFPTTKTNNDQHVSSQKIPVDPKTVDVVSEASRDIETKIKSRVARSTNDKKADGPVAKKTNKTEHPIDELIKNTEPERKLIESLTKKETETIITEAKEQTIEPETQKPITENRLAVQKEETKQADPVTIQNPGNKKQKNKNSFGNNFFFTASAGPDLSAVGNNTGGLRLAFGAGIGYQISKKFSIRTGFYTARKVYTADPEDYHPPTNFWTYYPNLKNIDANCKVYEIPVTLDYKINSTKKESWFVSAGVSSLLMKEEKYDYYFKPNYSPTYITYSKTIHNQNQHYFSILNLSGGYTRVVSKTVSLQAEPYFKIAMNGVGYGKVKLNSGGVLFSAIIKPFAKK